MQRESALCAPHVLMLHPTAGVLNILSSELRKVHCCSCALLVYDVGFVKHLSTHKELVECIWNQKQGKRKGYTPNRHPLEANSIQNSTCTSVRTALISRVDCFIMLNSNYTDFFQTLSPSVQLRLLFSGNQNPWNKRKKRHGSVLLSSSVTCSTPPTALSMFCWLPESFFLDWKGASGVPYK